MHFWLVSTDFDNWNVLRGQQETKVRCPIVFPKKLWHFCKRKRLKLTPIVTKIPNFSIFQRFYKFFLKIFDVVCGLQRWKRFNKERMCCLVCLEKKKNAVFQTKNVRN